MHVSRAQIFRRKNESGQLSTVAEPKTKIVNGVEIWNPFIMFIRRTVDFTEEGSQYYKTHIESTQGLKRTAAQKQRLTH